MRKKICISVIIVLVAIFIVILVVNGGKTKGNSGVASSSGTDIAVEKKYGKNFPGIAMIENAESVQDNMKEDSVGNTQGIKSYKVLNYTGSLDDSVNFIMDKSDKSLWDIEKSKNEKQPDVVYITFKAKSKDIKSTTMMTLNKSSNKLFITISSDFR